MTKEIEAAWENLGPQVIDPGESIRSHMFTAFKAGWLAAQSAPSLDDADALDRIEKIIKSMPPRAAPIWHAHDGTVMPAQLSGFAGDVIVEYKNGGDCLAKSAVIVWSQVAKWRFSTARVHSSAVPVAAPVKWHDHECMALVPMDLRGFAGDVIVQFKDGSDCVASPAVIMWSEVKRWRYA